MKPFQEIGDKNNVLRIFAGCEGVSTGEALLGGKIYKCALGKAGVCPAHRKKEDDGKTPAGLYRPLKLLFRSDKLPPPETTLATRPLSQKDGWCDDPESPDYNQMVDLPYKFGHEKMWRDDDLYDLVLVISHNVDPVRAGLGSAVFFHVARPDLSPTRGCVAFERSDFLKILKSLTPQTLIRIQDRPAKD